MRGQTSNLTPGFVRANIAIMPAEWAGEFTMFCHRNPKPCQIRAVTEPGRPLFEFLGDDVDARTDAPRYKVFRDGALVAEPTDLPR